MGCGCGKSSPNSYNAKQSVPNISNGTNQVFLRQIEEQQRQAQDIQQLIQKSANPNNVLIKTYR